MGLLSYMSTKRAKLRRKSYPRQIHEKDSALPRVVG